MVRKQIASLEDKLATRNDAYTVCSPLPLGFVINIFQVAEDASKRDKYYKKYLGKDHVRGGFVSHRMFVEFVKGAHDKKSCKEAGMKEFREKAKGMVDALANRNDRSFLATKKDHEAPQSLVASELLRMAVNAADSANPWEQNGPAVFVSRQGEMKRDSIESSDLLFTTGTDKNSLTYKVDLMVSVISEGLMKIIAAMEYKPGKGKEEARIAQRYMFATNTISLHRRPCIGVDIAGGP